jgi:hypothetical protein
MLTRTMASDSPQATPAARALVLVLFALVTVGALWVPLFNRVEPSIAGVPFFYWFQMSWIFAGAGATALAYKLKV